MITFIYTIMEFDIKSHKAGQPFYFLVEGSAITIIVTYWEFVLVQENGHIGNLYFYRKMDTSYGICH